MRHVSRELPAPAAAARSLNMRACLVAGLAGGFLLALQAAAPAQEIPPPFGFRWNDTQGRVEPVLKGSKAKIVARETKDQRETWTVEGLVHPGLKRALFTFKETFLVEIELQYEYPDWTVQKYDEHMGEIRRYFDEKFGTGKLISRSKDAETDVIQTLVGYQWAAGNTALELFYFSAERTGFAFRTISVHYKAL